MNDITNREFNYIKMEVFFLYLIYTNLNHLLYASVLCRWLLKLKFFWGQLKKNLFDTICRNSKFLPWFVRFIHFYGIWFLKNYCHIKFMNISLDKFLYALLFFIVCLYNRYFNIRLIALPVIHRNNYKIAIEKLFAFPFITLF